MSNRLLAVDPGTYTLPEEERRKRLVAVAQDVLKQLDVRKLVATPGTYVEWPEGVRDEKTDWSLPASAQELQKIVLEFLTPTKPCEVCAIGAAFVSYIGLFDGIQGSKKAGDALEYHRDVDPRHEMLAIFGEQRMRMMEAVFEAWHDDASSPTITDENWDAVRDFQDRLPHNALDNDDCDNPEHDYRDHEGAPELRLRLIMEQVIREGGTFLGV